MRKTLERLRLGEEVLALIDQKRAETGDERLDESMERTVLDMHLTELEREILENPGALEPWLVRRPRERV